MFNKYTFGQPSVSQLIEGRPVEYVDLIIIPGGDLDGINHFASLLPVNVPIILTGNHNIMDSEAEIPESHIAKKHLLWLSNNSSSRFGSNYAIDEKNILLEDKSVDQLSAAYFVKDYIEQILSGSNQKTIGVVTDPANMKTFSKCLEWNLNEDISFKPFFSSAFAPLKDRLYASLLTTVWGLDLSSYPIKPVGVEEYMQTKHPYFAKNPKHSNYGLLVKSSKHVQSFKNSLSK